MKIKPTHYQVQVKIFEMAGCVFARTKGDHLIYHYPGAIRPVVIPKYKEVPTFIIRNNMRIIGMSREKYLDLLHKL
ncbi:MAG: type II toxin-antitoxin system HicA family toxin [Deltaproteobacteria bacterium]|jgi:predicted RNA binding protein YcfA (HicA-like mRNA interferase family)|nr:type II toxin-antitoxin system HicA family toxin [Deltaproteobacteria bacterium]